MWSTFFILGQLLTLVSYLIFWISRFLKSKNNILLLYNISRLFAIIAFIFLGTYDGIKNTLYVILRNVLGQVTNNGTIMCNEQGIRIFGMIGSVFYTLFIFFTNNIVGTICEIICFAVMLISYLKYNDRIVEY